MKITIIGTGYVGLVSAAGFAEMGHEVIGVDIDQVKINQLNHSKIPFFEPGLKEIVENNIKLGRLKFTTDLVIGIKSSDVIFNCVGTPPLETGETDLSFVKVVAKSFGKNLNKEKLFINKSTVPIGTADICREIINIETGKNKVKPKFEIASNPEFLREGSAVRDFFNPDRIVCGVESKKSEKILREIYKPITKEGKPTTGKPIIFTDIKSAELIKYASNCFLATKISFINDIANFSEKVGANIEDVAKCMGMDERIGSRFLHAGIGYGGSCFPKDVKSLIFQAKKLNSSLSILEATEKINQNQKRILIDKLEKIFKNLTNKKIAILGLAFKPKTDDIREAPSLEVVEKLLAKKCQISVYDPIAMDNFKKYFKDSEKINFSNSSLECTKNADAVLILTEWDEFRNLDLKKLKKGMSGNVIIDGRNILDKLIMRKLNFSYSRIG